ncbi:MAG: hypothetical protein KDA22_09270 [Phycisphaerales bacterium]|nr:hypothetical protein [Phycisphaerales bacterium]
MTPTVIACAATLVLAAPGAASDATFVLEWSTIDGGGGTSSGGGFILDGTLGQPDCGVASGGSFVLSGGFWGPELVTIVPCPGDLDADGNVGPIDLGLLLAAWAGDGAADLDADGIVGAADLGLLLAAWGECPELPD